jgi:predicted Zn-dependent protease
VELSADAGLMTFLQDSAVAVPYGLLEAAGDDWLAIAVAHQIVHALLELSTERIDDPEASADRVGLLLAAQAGFDVGAAPAFWQWLASENPWRIASTGAFRIARPHPTLETDTEYPASQLHLGIARRLPAIRATVEEIRALEGRGR